MDLYLVRHGETAWSRARRHTSRTDVPLSPKGEEQARALGPVLAGSTYDLVLASPRRRAMDTARLAGYPDVDVREALVELDYGEYEGLTTPQIRQQRPDWDLFRDGCPGGETVAAVAARSRPLLEELAARDGNALVFGHGHALRVLTVTFLGIAPDAARHFSLGTASVCLLGREHEWPAVHQWNRQEAG